MKSLNHNHMTFVKCAYTHFDKSELTKQELTQVANIYDVKPAGWIQRPEFRTLGGLYQLPIDGKLPESLKAKYGVSGTDGDFCIETFNNIVPMRKGQSTITSQDPAPPKMPEVVEMPKEDVSLVPDKKDNYVPFGNSKDINSIIKSGIFYPVFVTGLSGNGKTFMVDQACARSNRELVRANITIETDEDDLLGGFRLVNGNTVWHNGPVVDAMERGAVLLLDEIDLASNKIMCLQPVLEGSGVYLKKVNRWVKPKDGFNVIATANTKGKGSEQGQFIGTNILNEAFLERFAITLEQNYPTPSVEKKILRNELEGTEYDEKFLDRLVNWADIVRKTYDDGGLDEVITTRRLVHIVNAFKIFSKEDKAINVCISRFDEDTKAALSDLYSKLDDKPVVEETETDEMPF